MNIFRRINEAVSKAIFCYRVTANSTSFLRLIWHSKKLRWSKRPNSTKRSSAPFLIQATLSNGKRDLFLRTYEGDIDIFFEVFYKQVYKLSNTIPNGPKIIVDLGSNTGLSAIYFMNRYSEATVFCVEPDPDNFKLLHKNLGKEITSGRVKAIEAAVMNYDGEVGFSKSTLKYNSHVNTVENDFIVNAISIGSLFKQFNITHIDLMKIDIEGAEKIIFSGDCSWLQKVTRIIIECHSPEDYTIMNFQLVQHNFTVQPLSNDPGNQQLYLAVKNT